MRLNKLILLMPLLMLAACVSPMIPTTGTVDAVPTKSATPVNVPKYVLCSEDPLISYAVPKNGQTETSANAFDTLTTVGDPKHPTRGTIEFHNQAHNAACK